MRHDAGVHQGGGGITIFMAEIGADHLLTLVADPAERQFEHRADFPEPLQEHLARLPMTLLEIVHYRLELPAKLPVIELENGIDQPLGPAAIGGALPGKVEGADDDPGRIRLESKRMELG